MLKTDWTTLDILSAPAEDAVDIVLIDADWRVAGPQWAEEVAGSAARRIGFVPDLGRRLDLMREGGSRLLAAGIGAPPASLLEWQVVGGYLFDALVDRRIASARLPRAEAIGGDASLMALLTGVLLHAFRLNTGRAIPRDEFRPDRLVLHDDDGHLAGRAFAAARPLNRARAYVERPANLLTPPAWANEIAASLEPLGITVRILDPAALADAGLGGLLAVGSGSEHGSYLVAAEWCGAKARSGWDAAWIGKGLTFDSGGLNLKPAPTIDKMKFDMAGGAAVLAAVELAALRQADANVVAIVPMADNAVDALSYRPGDVITSASGLTIEVANTDAEGRIALADAMVWAQRHYAPAWMIDVATLTAVAAIAFYEEYAACYANDDLLAGALAKAGKACGERVWRMPLDPRQRYLVESSVADVRNTGMPGFLGIASGSPTAAAQFLARFAGETKWAHIDIAGPAWATRRAPLTGTGATGFGGRLLDTWLTNLIEQRVDREGAH